MAKKLKRKKRKKVTPKQPQNPIHTPNYRGGGKGPY